jgi:hypothetical protein
VSEDAEGRIIYYIMKDGLHEGRKEGLYEGRKGRIHEARNEGRKDYMDEVRTI